MEELSTDWKYAGKWLKIGLKKYVLPGQSKTRLYEVVERVGKGDHDQKILDGINILPIAVSAKRHTKSIIVEKVYRPPVDKYCIEYPGGLIETGETKEEAAIRELREETGFSGSVLPDNNMRLLPIDLDAPDNETARQQLDEDELISTEFVPWESFPEAIDKYHEEGYGIELLVYYTALTRKLKQGMNLIDANLQKQLPNNTLIMIISSVSALFAVIQIIFIHTDWIAAAGMVSLFVSLESFFAASNFQWKELRFLIPLNLVMMAVDVLLALFLILLRVEHCNIASNYGECYLVSVVYGFFMLVGGVLVHGLLAVLEYYFYRLFPTGEAGGMQIVDTHLFNEEDLMKRVEEYDNMKRVTELHLVPLSGPSYSVLHMAN
ncbi:hypothetical protein WA577_001882 [Blastocystis sp. JDR]